MNELFYALIMITVIIVLILVFVLISYFYNNYSENKDKVNANFRKTSNYINDTNKTIVTNISTVDSKYSGITSKTNSDLTSLSSNFTSYVNTTNPLLSSFSSNLNTNTILNANTSSNLTKFDNNLKNFFEFRNNNASINEALFNYNFGVTPNLSLSLLQRIDAASGMTIKTDANQRSLKICDYANSNSCIDLNVQDGNFNIYPSASTTGTVNNLNIKKSGTGRVLANFDFNSNSIYLGGTGEDAGLYINENNVYLKNLNLLSNNARFNDAKVMYNSATPTQPYNTYSYNLEDVKRMNSFIAQPPNGKLIIGNYSLSNILLPPDNVPGTLLDIYVKSKFQIPVGTSINIELFEINIPASGSITLYNGLTGTQPMQSITITGKNATAQISTAIPPNTTVQFRNSGSSISINTASFPTIPINRAFISEF
jgi:hypothetical protein